ncbi:hypothetical protein BU17DRAFT_68638 [Hysterangium stoloniferum]|nr:hypothetical protein BU17DRAFT_68638 [Hysterangium stoloniferum]
MSSKRQEPKLGVEALTRHDAPASINIVVIHGVDGDRINSWTAADSSHSWLEYKRYAAKGHPQGQNLGIWLQPNILMVTSPEIRTDVSYLSRIHIPLKALILVKKEGHSSLNRLFAEVTKGIIFLGTPHQGVDVVKLYWIYGKLDNALKSDLAKYSEALQDQLLAHNTISHKSCPNGLQWFKEQSTPEQEGLNKDHFGLAKFSPSDDGDYMLVSGSIQWIIAQSEIGHKCLIELSCTFFLVNLYTFHQDIKGIVKLEHNVIK